MRTSRHLMPLAVALATCGQPADEAPPTGDLPREPCGERTPTRRVLWGDLHVHTAWSMDATAQDARVDPFEAWRFARGEPVTLPPLDANGDGTREARLARPLDFAALTDHAEFFGETRICRTPGLEGHESTVCRAVRTGGQIGTATVGVAASAERPTRDPETCGPEGQWCEQAAAQVWQDIQDAAEEAYDRTSACAFTSLVAYEYTGVPDLSVIHRNVIFRGSVVPAPVSYFQAQQPVALWEQLRTSCLDAGTGCDVLAIPHNPNQSNGRAFLPSTDLPLDQAVREAELRSRLEPLLEVFQHKGDSECANGLAGFLGVPDELCGFEKLVRPSPGDCGDGIGTGGQLGIGCFAGRDFARGALLTGLAEAERLGVNPYPLGFIASTDTHNGTPGAVDEADFLGHAGMEDAAIEERLRDVDLVDGGIEVNPGGLAAVWAEENTREAIFDALRRKETYGTSGPRLEVRVFGGWDLPEDLCGAEDAVERGYALGVPMGGDLPPRPRDTAPRLYVAAAQDPGTAARPGALLQRIQIIKGWSDDAGLHTEVFEVAGDPDNGATVDLDTCAPQGPGFASLCATWVDPDFDPDRRAFYYARVLENPTCRWSKLTCHSLPEEARPASCFDPGWSSTVQERAWTSPVWYTPPS